MFKFNNKNNRTTLMIISHIWTYFASFSNVSTVDFKQLNLARSGKSDQN